MNRLKQLYRKNERLWCNIIFPLILILYPLLTVNQGIDVSDSTYSLSNFLYFDRMEGMWVISTWLSNLCGWLLTLLPFGKTLLGMNVYTGLLVSATVLMVYFFMRKWMPAWIVCVGECVAVGFLWIPTTILYNYLTYFFFALGAILLFKGLVEEKNGWLFAAGVSLGLNVFVRIPNVTQMALILGLWYYLAAMNRPFFLIVKKTGYCVAGYLAGLTVPLAAVILQYGLDGLMNALTGLGAIQSADATYSPPAMLLAVFNAYGHSAKWALVIAVCIGLGMAMFVYQKGKYETVKKLLYLSGMAVLLRFLWGRGMFTFRYYEDYTSMYEWGMLGLVLAWICAVYLLGSVRTSREEKLWGVLSMVILAVSPLGSNNYTYQNLNNLFLVAPVTLYTFVKMFRYRQSDGPLSGLDFPWKAMVALVGAMILIQSAGFHLKFAFRDGMDGTPRDCTLVAPAVAAGMKTTQANARAIGALYSYLQEEELLGRSAVLFGDCPGLSFLLEMPFAISTAWPDLDSYPYDTFVSQLDGLEHKPVVIFRDTGNISGQRQEKITYLIQWMEANGYRQSYDDGEYEVYLADNS